MNDGDKTWINPKIVSKFDTYDLHMRAQRIKHRVRFITPVQPVYNSGDFM
jgi:hypothetical protein